MPRGTSPVYSIRKITPSPILPPHTALSTSTLVFLLSSLSHPSCGAGRRWARIQMKTTTSDTRDLAGPGAGAEAGGAAAAAGGVVAAATGAAAVAAADPTSGPGQTMGVGERRQRGVAASSSTEASCGGRQAAVESRGGATGTEELVCCLVVALHSAACLLNQQRARTQMTFGPRRGRIFLHHSETCRCFRRKKVLNSVAL